MSGASDGDGGWWQFYLIRYTIGTVIGALIFYLLCRGSPVPEPGGVPILAALLQMPVDAKDLRAEHLWLLLAYGLTFCYLAGAPVLVIHATRFVFQIDSSAGSMRRSGMFLAQVASVTAAIALVMYVLRPPVESATAVQVVAADLVIALVLGFQATLVLHAIFRSGELYRFYESLAAKRDRNRGSSLVESYRHLREHGNAYFIVFCELVFGIALARAGSFEDQITGKVAILSTYEYVSRLLVTVGAWIAPAVAVWMIATLIERRFERGG